MEIYNLITETTRRCNMRCPHCLRGNPQNKVMTKEILRKALSNFSYISTVTFTGGEPTLPTGLLAIYDFMDVCNELGIFVGSFYMVTNAKVWRPEIVTTIADLYDFCDDNEVSEVDISTDRFHDPIASKRRWFKCELEEQLLFQYGREITVSMRPEMDYENVKEEGRGQQFATGNFVDNPEIYVEDWDNELRITEGDIYLNCDGNFINGCDWSYESQTYPEHIICSVDDNFEEAIRTIASQIEVA